ncbi:hypothetical protein G9A89_007899 [Geosiphon pyriformis]|nr:hypothetical protein G9A89_007899 [Geosiphon pyriformis]
MENNELDEDDYMEAQNIEKINTTNRDAVFFAIDCSPSMLEEGETGDTPFHSAIRCASTVYLNKIIDHTQDYVGVLLFNTRVSKNKIDAKNIYMLQDIDYPDVDKIRELNEIAAGEIDFEQVYGSSDIAEFHLSDVLNSCRESLVELSASFKTKRIFLITDEDNPHPNNLFLRTATITRAKDLAELGIQINLFSVNRVDKKFNFYKFYSEIMVDDEFSEKKYICTSPSFDSLVKRIMAKEFPRRSIFSTVLRLAPDEDLLISVKGYALCIEKKRPYHHWAHMKAEVIKLAKPKTTHICADTETPLENCDIKYYFPYGGTKVVFTAEEIADLRQFGELGITLLGFKPANRFKFHHHITHPYFLYPDEEQFEGSTRTFAALHKKMLEMEKIAICFFRYRKGSVPRFGVLIPQEEELDENDVQIHPPGLQLHYLPYANDIRSLPEGLESLTAAPKELYEKLVPVVGGLNIKGGFIPEKMKNPALNRFYEVLQAIALEEQLPEIGNDCTMPKNIAIRKHCGEQLKEFNHEVLLKVSEIKVKRDELSPEPSKPKTGASKSKDTAKGEADVEALWNEGKASKATVRELKAYLNAAGIDISGQKKADLLQTLESCLLAKYRTKVTPDE